MLDQLDTNNLIILFHVSLTVFSVFLILVFFLGWLNASATSPSFGFREIRDPLFDIIDMKTCINKSTITILHPCTYTPEGNQSVDITAVDYSSDGKSLNATLWLVNPVKNISSLNNEEINYGMFIDADSNLETGFQGINYQVEISGTSGKWQQTTVNLSPYPNNYRVMKNEVNYTGFYKPGSRYVTLNANLTSMGFPTDYRVIFYAEECTISCSKLKSWKADFSSWIDIPPLKYTLLTTPTPIVLRFGEKQSVGIGLISDKGMSPEINNFMTKANYSNLNFKFPSIGKADYSSNDEPRTLEITVKEAKVGAYSIPIVANISKRSTMPRISDRYLNNGYQFEIVNLPFTVLGKMDFTEQLRYINETYISPLSGIYTFIAGLFTGGASRLIYNWIVKIKKGKRNNKPD